MPDKAFLNPDILKWARISARMTIESASSKIPVSADKLLEWEAGEAFPTIRQAKILANAYRRPFAMLFLPEIPLDFQLIQDFRMKGSRELSTSSVFLIRDIQQKQAWISEVLADNNEEKLPFVGRFNYNCDPKIVASNILETLNINPGAYKTTNVLLEWVNTAESNGIFISMTSFLHSRLKLDSEEIQGFAIADEYAPFIFINTEDWKAAQLFSLVHELVHIWIAKTGISNVSELALNNKSVFLPVELFCNEVAANVLLPDYLFKEIPSVTFNNIAEIYKVSKKYGVSSFPLLIRALDLKIINIKEYNHLKAEAEIKYNEYLKIKQTKKKSDNHPDYYLLHLYRNGKLFTQTVLDAFKGGHIESNLASSLLNIQINKFNKLEAQLYK
ncbi:MAG: ImmA/IrrE family metallo-endopeptidase [Clostridiales bacterium]